MVMLTHENVRRIAAGTPDTSSGEFRSAVAAVSAWLRIARNDGTIAELEALKSSLLAHGEPVRPKKPTKEELSAIRREASARGLVARSKASLAKKLETCRSGIVSADERKPAIFDAALELIEDGDAVCTHSAEKEGVRLVTISSTKWELPSWALRQECPWKSKRRQEEERI